jgi:REP element-mobilizing transposase RayT
MEKSRKPTRLKEYDYSQNGKYFITICTFDMKRVLSSIKIVGEGLRALPIIELSDIGLEIKNSIEFSNSRYKSINIEKYVIMPNHIHLLISINNQLGGHGDPPLQDVIRDIKSYTTHKYGSTLWQRSYFDHIIRNEEDYIYHIQYIEENPKKWIIGKDKYYA